MNEKKIIAVTGALGFIGSYIVEECLKLGWYVYGIDAGYYGSNEKNLERFLPYKNNFKFIREDINNLKELPDIDVLCNAAAFTHVDMSISDSKSFIHSNINGAYNLLELFRKTSYSRKLPLFLHISCYDEKTRALTKNGFKYFSELKNEDEVISINPITRDIEFKKIKKIIVQDYKGEMIHFKHRMDDLMVTPNHRMYLDNIRKNKIEINTADEVCNKYGLYYLNGKKKGIISDTYNINGIGSVSIKDLFYVSGIFIGNGFTAYQKKKVKNKSGLNREQYMDLCRKNGKFVKNTQKGNQEYTECNSYRIFFDVPQLDKARKKLELTLTNLGIKWHSHKGKSGEHIYFSSKEWIEFFEQFGKYIINKTIPDWMFDYDHSILYELYDGLIGSDGHWTINKNNTKTGRLTTISYNLVQKSCILGITLGFNMRYSLNNKSKKISIINGREIIPKHQAYTIFFNNQKIQCGNKKYKREDYCGKIWCLTVEDNKNFVVERNGLLKISGNTDEVYSDIQSGSHKETDKLNPSNPYSASKSCADQLILGWARTYNIPYIIVRPTNNYGKYQWTDTKLIPRTCKYLQLGKKIQLHNNGTPIRTWLNSFDTAQAIIHIINSNVKNEIYNISGNCELKNIEVVQKIIKIIKNEDDPLPYCDFSFSRKGQDLRYSINDDKLKALGWTPKCNFDEELPKIVEFYKNNFIW